MNTVNFFLFLRNFGGQGKGVVVAGSESYAVKQAQSRLKVLSVLFYKSAFRYKDVLKTHTTNREFGCDFPVF